MALGYALGLFAGRSVHLPLAAVALLAIALAAAYLRLRFAGLRVGMAALLLAGGLAGLARSDAGLLYTDDGLEAVHGYDVTLRANVVGLAEPSGGSLRLQAAVTDVLLSGGWTPAGGRVIVRADPAVPIVPGRDYPFVRHGDTLTLHGTASAPSDIGVFDYREHLAAQGIGTIIERAEITEVTPGPGGFLASVHALRLRLDDSLRQRLPEPAASLAPAVLLGLRAGMPAELSDDFRGAGLAHLLAVSGLHVGLVLALALLASQALLGRRRGLYLIAPLVLLWGYILLAGAPPSAVRAGLMGSAFLLALGVGRLPVAVNALGFAALALLLLDPGALWNRSFQLSFSAMAGVLLLGLPAVGWLRERSPDLRERLPAALARLVEAVVASLVVSVGAFMGALPLTAFNFGEVPLLGAPATLLAMAVMPAFLVLSALTGLAGLVFPLGAFALAVPAWLLGKTMAVLAGFFAGVPGGVVTLDNVSVGWVWAGYALLACAIAVVSRRRWTPAVLPVVRALWEGPSRRTEKAILLGVVAVFAVLPWAAADPAAADGGLLRIHVLDVGQGDAMLLTTPAGASVLIDGGRDAGETISQVDEALLLDGLRLDMAVLTHPHADHSTGLMELARRGRFDAVLAPPVIPGESAAWRDELDALGVEVTEAVRGMSVALPGGVALEVLNPPRPLLEGTASDVDNNAVALRVVYGDATALLMADVFVEGEWSMIDAGVDLSADVIKVGHHGSRTSTSQELLMAVRPSAAVVSVAADSPFGHPSEEVMERVAGSTGLTYLYSTAEHGSVRFSSDGIRWWASVERGTD